MLEGKTFRNRGIGKPVAIMLFIGIFAVGNECGIAAAGFLGNQLMHSAKLSGPGIVTHVELQSFSIEDVVAEPGTDVALRITLPSAEELAREDSTEGTFILIRNVPKNIRISSGMSVGKNWIVPLREAKSLHFTSAADTEGKFLLEFFLIGSGNRVLVTKTVIVSLQSEQSGDEAATSSLPEETLKPPAENVNPTTTSKSALALPPEEEAVLLTRATQLQEEGGIAAARLIYEELASRGSSKGAFALARTYDPAFVPTIPGSTLSADIEKALKWYEHAGKLGNPEAERRRAEIRGGS